MAITVLPVDAVAGEPQYSGREWRQAQSALIGGATSARPLGARSGVRPGTPASTVEATSTTWTCRPHAGVLDTQASAIAGPYLYAVDADETGSVTAANATNPRKDIIYAQLSDPAESDGSTAPKVEIKYLAGTAAASPARPATPARSSRIATIDVPVSGGGSPTVTFDAPYAVAPGGIVPVRDSTERAALAAWATAESPVYASMGGILYVCNDGSTWKVAGGRTVIVSGALSGTYAGQPLIEKHINGTLTTDANGDTIVLAGADFAGGGVLNVQAMGGSTLDLVFARRMLSGNVVLRVYNTAGTPVTSNTVIAGVIVTYWTA